MSDELHLSIVPSDPLGTRLHDALQKTLTPPPLPEGFHARVLAQVLDDQLQQLEARRLALELEHAKAMQQLRRGHVLLQRDTLALITVFAFAAGTCAHLAVPWINETFNLDSALTVPMIALVIGLATGASAWVERFGKPGKLFGVGQD
jgi:hypothetical protein